MRVKVSLFAPTNSQIQGCFCGNYKILSSLSLVSKKDYIHISIYNKQARDKIRKEEDNLIKNKCVFISIHPFTSSLSTLN